MPDEARDLSPPAVRITCPGCRTVLSARFEPGATIRCPKCRQVMRVRVAPDSSVSRAGRVRRQATYLHHSRDTDGDVILFFTDQLAPPPLQLLRSSPIAGIQRLRHGEAGGPGTFLVSSRNTDYEVQMSAGHAEHLAMELGVDLV